MTEQEINALVDWISIGVNILFIIVIIPLIVKEIKDIREMKKAEKQINEKIREMLNRKS